MPQRLSCRNPLHRIEIRHLHHQVLEVVIKALRQSKWISRRPLSESVARDEEDLPVRIIRSEIVSDKLVDALPFAKEGHLALDHKGDALELAAIELLVGDVENETFAQGVYHLNC